VTGLVLKLKPNEKFLINGVILQNGDRPSRLRVRTAGASVLRLRDALHPEETVTPLRKLYYVAQLAVAGAANEASAKAEILAGLDAVGACASADLALCINEAKAAVQGGKLFAVMRALRRGFAFEDGAAAPTRSPCSSPPSR